MKLKTAIALFLTALLISGCGINGANSFCLEARPLYLTGSERAALSPQHKRDILDQDDIGAEQCGWAEHGSTGK